MDIQQILRQYAGAVAASDANIAAQEAAIGNESAALAATYGKMQGLQQSAAALSEEAVNNKLNAELAADQFTQGMQQQLGVTESLAAMLGEYNALQPKKAELARQHAEIMSISPFDDPLGFVLGRLQAPTIAQQHNAMVDLQSTAINDYAQRSALLRDAKSSITLSKDSALKDAAVTDAKAKRLEAELRELQLTSELSSKQAALAAQRANLHDKRLDNTAKLFSAQMGFAQFQMAAAERAEARAERADARAERNAAKRRVEQQQAEFDLERMRMARLIGWSALPKKFATQAQESTFMGMAGSNMLGQDPLDAHINLQTVDAALPAMRAQDPLFVNSMFQAAGEVNTIFDKLPALNTKTGKEIPIKERRQQAGYDWLTGIYNSAHDKNAKSINERDSKTFNPYRVDYTRVLELATSGAADALRKDVPQVALLQDNIALKDLQNSSKLTGIEGNTKETAWLKQYLANPGATEAERIERRNALVALHKAGAAINLHQYKYTLYGVPVPSSYIVKIPGPYGVGVIPVDIFSLASVDRAQALLNSQPSSTPVDYGAGNPNVSIQDIFK